MTLSDIGILPQYYTVSQPRRWRQHGPPKRWYTTTTLYGVTNHKAMTWIFIDVKISNHATWLNQFNKTSNLKQTRSCSEKSVTFSI